MSYQLVEGDTGVVLRTTCTEGDPAEAIDLTGFSALLRWKSTGTVVEKAMTITDAPNGVVQYQFATGDITPPDMEFEIVLTDEDGKVRASLQTFRQRVRERLA
jgi:hypothetical protein